MSGILIILFGATGDLARRKLIPALYAMSLNKRLRDTVFLFIGREETTAAAVLQNARPFIKSVDDTVWHTMNERSYYQCCDITNADAYGTIYNRVTILEQRWNTYNRLVYCAVASDFFCAITKGLSRVGILQKDAIGNPWHRIVYEKPFGRDLPSAHAINLCIASAVSEQQVFRIDHYLAKEIVSNIALIRFTNCIFEPLWNNRFIEHIEINIIETVDIEHRAGYYDTYGALRDVVQNHMLQLLALIAMESPIKLTGNHIRDRKTEVIQQIHFIDGILGQYQTYGDTVHKPTSRTETFAALLIQIRNARWAGVPFLLKTGKCLDEKKTVINVVFKPAECILTKQCPPDRNILSIRIAPDAAFELTLNAKKPAAIDTTLMPITMEFCHSCHFELGTAHEYEFLLQEVIRGEQAVSVRFDEIEYAWRLIDSIYAHHLPLYVYKNGTMGPKELASFLSHNGIRISI